MSCNNFFFIQVSTLFLEAMVLQTGYELGYLPVPIFFTKTIQHRRG
jgi:hypothetical protein